MPEFEWEGGGVELEVVERGDQAADGELRVKSRGLKSK